MTATDLDQQLAELRSVGGAWRVGRNAVYQLAALTIGAPVAVADG
jgi:hypothetical protein